MIIPASYVWKITLHLFERKLVFPCCALYSGKQTRPYGLPHRFYTCNHRTNEPRGTDWFVTINFHTCVQNLQLLDPSYTRQIQLTQLHSISSKEISKLLSHLGSGLSSDPFSSRLHKFCCTLIFHNRATCTLSQSPSSHHLNHVSSGKGPTVY